MTNMNKPHLLEHYVSVCLARTIHKCQTDTRMTKMKADERVNLCVCIDHTAGGSVHGSHSSLCKVHQSPIN